jgi:hypothetical protein
MKKVKIDLIKEIKFPEVEDFAESFINKGKYIYIPINNTKTNRTILYKFNKNKNKLIKVTKFPKNTVTLGSKINKNNIFAGTITTLNSIYTYNLDTKDEKMINLNNYGCPNDLCFDNKDSNIIWVVSNINEPGNNGVLLKINIVTNKIKLIKKDLESIAGINILNDNLYFATLTEVYKFNKKTKKYKIIDNNIKDHIFYDNINIYKNNLNIAIFNYDCNTYYNFFKKYNLTYYLMLIMKFFIKDLLLLNKKNFFRDDTKTIIKYYKQNLVNYKNDIIEFDKIIKGFDKEVTQISQISDNEYILVNWIANKMIIVKID